MIEQYLLEREREQAQLTWEGRWKAELRRLRRADKAERRTSGGPVARLRGLFAGSSRRAELGRG